MKELIYIHASSSYLASHFFNTQQSYFTFDDSNDDKPVLVDPDVSFREGLALDVSQRLPPSFLLIRRLLRAQRLSVLAFFFSIIKVDPVLLLTMSLNSHITSRQIWLLVPYQCP